MSSMENNEAMSLLNRAEIAKENYETANYIARDVIDEKIISALCGLAINLHEAEKLNDQLIRDSKDNPSLQEKFKKLGNCFDDIYNIMRKGSMGSEKQKEILKKYAHNIPSVIKPNKMILLLNHNISEKNLIGNKGANLVEMYNLGIKVPQSIFLTTVACKQIHKLQDVPFIELLMQTMYMFGDNEKIAVRSSGVVSMAGMMDTVLDIDRNDENAVKKAILDVVNSWDSERAKSFRKVCKIDDEVKIAIVIQPVIRGDKGYSGIFFSRNPNTGKDEIYGEYLDKQLGDKLANGEVTPKKIKNEFGNVNGRVLRCLVETAGKLEKHFKSVQDIEFVYDGTDTYFVQTRSAQLSPMAKIKTLVDFYNEGIISQTEFKMRYDKSIHEQVYKFEINSGEILFKGTPAVNGIFTGKACFDKTKANENSILILENTTPDDMPYIEKIGGLITKIGGMTSHPAVVCRQMNKPCIIGAKMLDIDSRIKRASFGYGIHEIHEGNTITIIGDTGEVYCGTVEPKKVRLFEKEVEKIISGNEND